MGMFLLVKSFYFPHRKDAKDAKVFFAIFASLW